MSEPTAGTTGETIRGTTGGRTKAGAARVVCVGSMMIDLIFYLERAPEAGETVFGEDFAQGFGGKGANQAVVARLLGAEVAMVGALGEDDFGRATLENFRALGINASGVRLLEGTYSGVAGIMVDPSGENRIVLGAGANTLLTPAHVTSAIAQLGGGGGAEQAATGRGAIDVVLSQLEVPQPTIIAAFTAGKAQGATTVLTPAPATELDPQLVAVTDWLVPNHHELGVLAGVGEDVGETPPQWVAAAQTYAERTDTSIVLTMGRDGAALVRPGLEAVLVPAQQVTAVDTTGAGDALCGAFAWALADGREPIEALHLATRYAADSVTRKGTQRSYARGEQLAAILEE